jgi:hypothetical protein
MGQESFLVERKHSGEEMKIRIQSLILCCLMLYPALPALAQVEALRDVPPGISTDLERKHDELAARRDQIMQQLAAHNAKCTSVLEGSPAAVACASERSQLQSEINQYGFDVKRFNDSLDQALQDAQSKPATSTHAAPPHTRIGAAAAVRGTVYWLTSDGRKVPITAGGPVYSNARIVTGDNSRLQLLLLDETVFTMGANSDIVLDDFVYDTDPSAHTITANVMKGIFRFVTGKVAQKRPEDLKVTLPVGTIGIRGTDFEGTVNPDGSGSIVLHSGQLEVTEKKTGSTFLMNAGEKVTFSADGSFSSPTKFL